MSNSRTDKAIKNIKVVIVCQFFTVLIKFICKTFFTTLLGKEYAGVNGVFSNILSLLSFVELGMGSAIVYRLYGPLQNNDREKIRQYLNLYKKIYRSIAIIIFVLGIMLIPFLEYIADAPDVKENIVFIYLLFLMNTCISYTFIYKKQILIADQKTYITSVVQIAIEVSANLINICFLYLFHNYIIYLLVLITATVTDNIICSNIANRQYPYINKKEAIGSLSSGEIHDFIEDVKGLFLTKCAATAFGSTDNIFISRFLGVSIVGIVGQYTSLVEIFTAILGRIFGSITASVGNLCIAKSEGTYKFKVFKRIYFVNAVISGYVCLGMLLLEELFVTELWYDQSFALSTGVVTLIIVEWYLKEMHYPIYLFRTADGHFAKLKWVSLAGAIINIVLDFVLIQNIGLAGIFIATIISRFIVRISDIVIVCRYVFNNKMIFYYRLHMGYIFIVFVLFMGLKYLIGCIKLPSYLLFPVGIILITIVYFLIIYSVFHKSDEWKYLLEIIKNGLRKIKMKRQI